MKMLIFPFPSAKPEKNTFNIDSFLVEHHQKSRLGNAETFEIVTAARPGRLAPLKHVPKLSSENKNNANIDESDLQAKIAAKLERASRKRRVKRQNIVFEFRRTVFVFLFAR